MATASDLTPTSYALLGLLAIKPWTTYELAQQMERTMSRFWPRAQSKLYEEPKKLVARGLAEATVGAVGRRRRTVYAITSDGRRALSSWLAAPTHGPALESEPLMKVFFADGGTTEDLRQTLRGVRDWAHGLLEIDLEVARSYLGGACPFPERAAVNMLVGRFLIDYVETVDRWAQWATVIIEDWPEHPADAMHDPADLAEVIERITQRAGLEPEQGAPPVRPV